MTNKIVKKSMLHQNRLIYCLQNKSHLTVCLFVLMGYFHCFSKHVKLRLKALLLECHWYWRVTTLWICKQPWIFYRYFKGSLLTDNFRYCSVHSVQLSILKLWSFTFVKHPLKSRLFFGKLRLYVLPVSLCQLMWRCEDVCSQGMHGNSKAGKHWPMCIL